MKTLDGSIDVTPLRAGGIRSMIKRDVSQSGDLDEEMEGISANVYRDWYELVWLTRNAP
jgi:hypothetical protein